MHEYINCKEINDTFICGKVHYPAHTHFVTDEEGFLLDPNGKGRLCWDTSEHAYQCFTFDDDGAGDKRCELTNKFYDMISNLSYEEKDNVYAYYRKDKIAALYCLSDDDMWVWDRHKIMTGQIWDLEHLISICEKCK